MSNILINKQIFKHSKTVFKTLNCALSIKEPSRYINISINLSNKKTALYDYHVSNGGKMVTFANYLMPINYSKVGISASHNHVRSKCGLFDVSHMLQTKIHGKDKIKLIESLTVGDIQGLNDNVGTLTLFTNENGGIIDDLIVSKVKGEYLYVVSNAGCKEKDLQLMQQKVSEFKSDSKDVEIEVLQDMALIALQGPLAEKYLQNFCKYDLKNLYFMNTAEIELLGTACRVTRCGYTGEDGFEISINNGNVVELCEELLSISDGGVQLAGLGARDSLRLEAGLCLYGNDMDETTTPVQASLAWTVAKRRRTEKDFPGAQIILDELRQKPLRRRVGLMSKGGAPPRAGCLIVNQNDEEIGKVTSGCPSPSVGANLSMAYVQTKDAAVGTSLQVKLRGKTVKAIVSKMPFVKTNYYFPPKA